MAKTKTAVKPKKKRPDEVESESEDDSQIEDAVNLEPVAAPLIVNLADQGAVKHTLDDHTARVRRYFRSDSTAVMLGHILCAARWCSVGVH